LSQTREPNPYIGRFAPSPSGPLHFGSLAAAVASYLQARSNSGRWLLRIEDIDPPREQPGASTEIIQALDHYGFEWDGEILYQSENAAAHEAALDSLMSRNLAYRCQCSRSDLADAPRGAMGIIYPGTCRNGCGPGEAAVRLLTNKTEISFEDILQKRFSQHLETESGDFVIRRRDGLIAYHLAVVVDDEIQGVTEIVRGIDLLDSTPRHIWLQRQLGYSTPAYVHIPVITHVDGVKLSKLTGAPPIPLRSAGTTLCASLAALFQEPPAELSTAPLSEIWTWAFENWHLEKLEGQKAIANSP
jgi:glutamyl-Q tRNA(Asp) synthetase